MLLDDLLIVFRSYFIGLGIQLLVWPLIKKIFHRLPDSGWALGRVIITMFSALVIWQLSFLGFTENSVGRVWGVIVVMALVGVWLLITDGVKSILVSKASLKIILMEEYLFLVGFVAMALIRGHAPSLDSLEKFMDFGFLKQYVVSPTLPVSDMWQAGQTINYYSFGHYWTSVWVRLWGVTPTVGYNLMLAFIFGSALSLVFLATIVLSGNKGSRSSVLGGVIGALAVLLAGNSFTIWHLLTKGNFNEYWYADATRFIHNTIHEFPSYSFVVSDLHGHVLDLPIVLMFLIFLFIWHEKRERVYEVLLGGLLGVMMMTNTWDCAVYGMVLFILSMVTVISSPKEVKKLIVSGGVILLSMLLTAFPWWLSFKLISGGIGVVTERSPLWQLLVLWSGGVVASINALFTEGKGKQKTIILVLALSALALIAIPEFIYARDIYPNHPRANTMFKLTYQAFILMGILLGVTFGKLIDKSREMRIGWRLTALVILVFIFGGAMIFPFRSFPVYYNNFSLYYGLDGGLWMAKKMPENYGAVMYLDQHRDGKNLVEAVGDSYSLSNSVSVFSGVPSIQGWRVHEWLWRGGYDTVSERETEVREIYQGKSLESTLMLLKKYNVGWILIGQDEKITYKINEEKLWQTGEMVWSEGESYLIKVDPLVFTPEEI